jgi:hypothetical protein
MIHLSLWTVVNTMGTGLVSVKLLVTLWHSKFLLMTPKSLFTAPTSILLVTHLAGTYEWTPLMLNPLWLSSSFTVLPLSASRGGFYGCHKWWCQWFDWQWLPLYVHHLHKWFSRLDVPYGPKGRWAVTLCLYCGIFLRWCAWPHIVWWPPQV